MKKLILQNRLYQCPYTLVGITGGIATGKSYVLKVIKDLGYFTLSADALVKEIYQSPDGLSFITQHCNEAMESGTINYKKLRQWAFTSTQNIKTLEDFSHPRLKNLFLEKVAHNSIKEEIIFYEIPLLFEKNLQNYFDVIFCVTCSPSKQISRVIVRDGSTEETVKNILNKQMDLNLKASQSDFVILNEDEGLDLNYEIQNKIKLILTH